MKAKIDGFEFSKENETESIAHLLLSKVLEVWINHMEEDISDLKQGTYSLKNLKIFYEILKTILHEEIDKVHGKIMILNRGDFFDDAKYKTYKEVLIRLDFLNNTAFAFVINKIFRNNEKMNGYFLL